MTTLDAGLKFTFSKSDYLVWSCLQFCMLSLRDFPSVHCL